MDKKVIPNSIILEDAGALLQEGRTVRFTPLGSSMLPFIHGGKDSVVLEKKDTVEVGDIVLARLQGRYVLHRVIKADGDSLTLMGDGNIRGTESCTKADIMGTVTQICKSGGKIIIPGDGKFWRRIKPFFRRYILAIYRRII